MLPKLIYVDLKTIMHDKLRTCMLFEKHRRILNFHEGDPLLVNDIFFKYNFAHLIL
jgi:hypothetical protein